MGSATTTNTPANQVDDLIKQVADEAEVVYKQLVIWTVKYGWHLQIAPSSRLEKTVF